MRNVIIILFFVLFFFENDSYLMWLSRSTGSASEGKYTSREFIGFWNKYFIIKHSLITYG